MDLSENLATVRTSAPAMPVLRSVLLCDIVDSTAMVERLGDRRAAELMQRHDTLLRRLIAFCHGQLIDRADGVLALFERPIQALDFALRYQRGLLELGREEGLELKARAGLHVGDVVMWANDPHDVLAGAKAFEIEGLAKPVAARLMNLASPGQILMSGMAQNLCQRAVGELGDTGPKLRWLLHGRYRFKGVPAPMLVHEVGEPGLSPLRAPESGAKAWRELPLWRRPPVLALEFLALGALVIGGVMTTLRAPPAIAFAERDWVVVADLQNRTDEPLFDDALDTALLVGLEQSRHVNVISQLQIDRALERMQRQGQPVDRQLATELALREGARAVILPTVAEVGGVVRVSLEVIDPQSGVTVYSESADATGEDHVLDALDTGLRQVRGHLGEALSSVEASSAPLETVTTDDIEALRSYSLGVQARYEGRLPEAEVLFEEAVKLDPDFAMASLQLAFMRYVENDSAGTRRYLEMAERHRDHLTRREALFLDAAAATLDDPARALERFKLLGNLYPDEFRAYRNYAWFAHVDLLRTAEARVEIEPALSPKNPRAGQAHYLAGVLDLALNRYADAADQFDRARLLGVGGFNREHVETFMAQRHYDEAERLLGSDSRTGSQETDIEMRLVEITMPLDRGRIGDAIAAARAVEQAAADTEGMTELHRWNTQGIALAVRSLAPDRAFAGDLRAYVAAQPARLRDTDVLDRRHVVFQALAAGWLAANAGDDDGAAAMLAAVGDDPLVAAFPANAAMRRSLVAERALADGRPLDAIDLLAADDGTSYFERAVLLRAYLAAERWAEAAELADWLAENRGRAFAEPSSLGHWQAIDVAESTLALKAAAVARAQLGEDAAARAAADAFASAWPEGDEAEIVRRRFAGR